MAAISSLVTKRCSKCCFAEYQVEYNKANAAQIAQQIKKYRRTISGFTATLWCRLNSRTVNGTHPNWKEKCNCYYLLAGVELRLTREQLYEFVTKNWDTIQAIRAAGETPSIDRIGPSIHYSLDNIRFITRSENSRFSMLRTLALKNKKDEVRHANGNLMRTYACPRFSADALEGAFAALESVCPIISEIVCDMRGYSWKQSREHFWDESESLESESEL